MLPESLGVYVTGKNAIEIEIHKSYNTLTPTWTLQKHYLIPSLTGGDALDIDDAFDVMTHRSENIICWSSALHSLIQHTGL